MATHHDAKENPGVLEEEAIALDDLAATEARPCVANVASASSAPLIGEVLDTHHPTRSGCALVRLDDADPRWIPALQGLSLHAHDQVLVLRPGNALEPVIVGVLDGLHRPAEPARAPAAGLALQPGETLSIAAADGKPLVELFQGERGPVLRLIEPDLDVELPGKLRVRADSLDLAARRGAVHISASDDVVVVAETIKLN
ncbi:MAG: hypothetical protein ABI193_11245 [Minicystis sp.]